MFTSLLKFIGNINYFLKSKLVARARSGTGAGAGDTRVKRPGAGKRGPSSLTTPKISFRFSFYSNCALVVTMHILVSTTEITKIKKAHSFKEEATTNKIKKLNLLLYLSSRPNRQHVPGSPKNLDL